MFRPHSDCGITTGPWKTRARVDLRMCFANYGSSNLGPGGGDEWTDLLPLSSRQVNKIPYRRYFVNDTTLHSYFGMREVVCHLR